MRIITGKYKGRKLVAPKGETRPTLDRTKETLFNIISNRLNDAVVVDLFAGSGQIALECLSRGAKKAILCDNDKYAVDAIRENFSKIGVEPNLYVCDYAVCLQKNANLGADLIFVDPPYRSGFYNDVLQLIGEYNVLNNEGIVVCERLASNTVAKSDVFDLFDSRKIGTVCFDFYSLKVD